MYNGIIVLDKMYRAPSRGCVNTINRALGGRKQKMGHAGTLDTSASGTLVLMAGNATRLCEAVMNLPKTYLANVTFGWETSTDDATGTPLSDPVQAGYDEGRLISALPGFQGVRLQTPPQISAVRVDGLRAHSIARSGKEADIQPRPVNMTALTYLGRAEDGSARLLVKCHRGTYIRSLGRDLGRVLGQKAHLSGLRRLNVGPFRAENGLVCNPQEDYSEADVAPRILPVDVLASQYYCYTANEFCEKRLRNGMCVFVSYLTFRNAGIVPVSQGVAVLGKEILTLGRLDIDKGRPVIVPEVNIPREVNL